MEESAVTRFKAQTLRDLESLAPAWNLEQLLDALCRYGKPRLSRLSDGWHCAVDMNVTAEGVMFETRSDFNCVSAGDAARQCTARMIAALRIHYPAR